MTTTVAGSKIASVQTSRRGKLMEIYQRMGHPSFHLLKHMYPHLFKDIDTNFLIRDACQLGKFKQATYSAHKNWAKKSFHLLHCDVWGPSPHIDLLTSRYFLICTDDHNRFSWLFLLKTKSKVTHCIQNLCVLIEQ